MQHCFKFIKNLKEHPTRAVHLGSKTFTRITVPLTKPALFNGLNLVILVSKLIGTVIMIYSNESIVISLLVWELWANGGIPETSTVGVLLMSVLICLAFVARRYGSPSLE
jgi:iron(III) transport system permease protein